jgi:hypothetical protein
MYMRSNIAGFKIICGGGGWGCKWLWKCERAQGNHVQVSVADGKVVTDERLWQALECMHISHLCFPLALFCC